MTNRLWIGLVFCGALLLSVGATPTSADDCQANLNGYSWQCRLENVDDHQRMDFVLRFNQSVAQIVIGDMEASGPFGCEMHRKFFSREFVSGRTFFASLFSYFGQTTSEQTTPILTLTGDSYWRWILNGNGQMANVSILSNQVSTNITTYLTTNFPINTVTDASAFVYKCGSPTRLDR